MQSATIPSRFTCDGANVSPPLEIAAVPDGTHSLAVSVVDLDAPGGSFAHWLVYAISPDVKGIEEAKVPPGALQGTNSFGKRVYGGPCPPKGSGPHRYVFTLYALRNNDGLTEAGVSVDRFRSAVNAAAHGSVSFTKTYQRS